MDITFSCDKCGQPLKIDAAGAGQSAQCPKCGQLLTVPAATSNPGSTPVPSSIPAKKKCPYCAEEILTDAIKCKHCGEFLSGKTAQAPVAVPPLLPLNQPPQRKTTERRSGGVMAPSFFRMVGRITAVANHHRGLAVAASIILMLCLIGLFGQTCNPPSKIENQDKGRNSEAHARDLGVPPVTENQDKGAYPAEYDAAYTAGLVDARYPADALTHSDAERESLARKMATEIYHIEDSQVDQWVESFKRGYAAGYKDYNNPSSGVRNSVDAMYKEHNDPANRPFFDGVDAGRTMRQQGSVKPSDAVVDALARRAGISDTVMWKMGFEKGWRYAQ